MTDREPDPAEAGRELLRLVDELTPVLHYGIPISDAQWRQDKAKCLADLRGEITAPSDETDSTEATKKA